MGPVTKKAWDARAKTKSGDCGRQSVYHCLTDSEGGKWERCVEKTLVIEGTLLGFTFTDHQLCYNKKFEIRQFNINKNIYDIFLTNDRSHIYIIYIIYYIFLGNCPIFNEDGFIDWKPCDKTKPPCPNSSFVSEEVYNCKCYICTNDFISNI